MHHWQLEHHILRGTTSPTRELGASAPALFAVVPHSRLVEKRFERGVVVGGRREALFGFLATRPAPLWDPTTTTRAPAARTTRSASGAGAKHARSAGVAWAGVERGSGKVDVCLGAAREAWGVKRADVRRWWNVVPVAGTGAVAAALEDASVKVEGDTGFGLKGTQHLGLGVYVRVFRGCLFRLLLPLLLLLLLLLGSLRLSRVCAHAREESSDVGLERLNTLCRVHNARPGGACRSTKVALVLGPGFLSERPWLIGMTYLTQREHGYPPKQRSFCFLQRRHAWLALLGPEMGVDGDCWAGGWMLCPGC